MPRISLASLLVVAALAATTGAIAAPVPAVAAESAAAQGAGGVGVRLMDIPVATAGDPRARQYIVDHLPPGSVVERRIAVANTTDDPLRVALYPAAAAISDGAFRGADGSTPNELSSWTSLDRDVVEIDPGTETPVVLTLTVPVDAAPGEQYAAVWAEIRSPGDAGVVLVNRVGIRMYVSVGGGNAPASGFAIETLTAERSADGRPAVTAQVTNTGGRALDMSGTLMLSGGPGSLNAGPFPAQLGATLAPGQSADVSVPLDEQLPAGPWNARLDLRSGLVEQSAEATIRFPDDPGAVDVAAASPLGGIPWPLLIGAPALIALVLLATVVRRRARRPTVPHP
ncbi:hypothetical protein ACVGOW_25245 [Pseudonocardia saturnea]